MAKASGGTRAKAPSSGSVDIGDTINGLSSKWHGMNVLMTESVFKHPVFEDREHLEQVAKDRGDFGRFGVIKDNEQVVSVSASSLHPTQEMVSSNNVKSIAESIKAESMKEMPTAVKYDGKIYVLDGHHRVAAALILKQKNIKIRLL